MGLEEKEPCAEGVGVSAAASEEPELVLRLIVVAVVVVLVEVKLMLWRSSAKSSSQGSIGGRERRVGERDGKRLRKHLFLKETKWAGYASGGLYERLGCVNFG